MASVNSESLKATKNKSITYEDLMGKIKDISGEKLFSNIKELSDIFEELQVIEKITYSTKITDPFLFVKPLEEGKYNLDNLLAWYKIKNPGYAPIETVDPEIPEYKYIVASMLKDLIILALTSHFPNLKKGDIKKKQVNPGDNNRIGNICEITNYELQGSEITDKSILDVFFTKINRLIESGYKYTLFIDLMIDYLVFFTIGTLDEDEELMQQCFKEFSITTLKQRLLQFPYIVYPSTIQVSYAKTLYFCQAPVINFRLSNSRNNIHNSFQSPLFEVYHDLYFHAEKTNDWLKTNNNLPEYFKYLSEKLELEKSKRAEKIKKMERRFENASGTFQSLKKILFLNLDEQTENNAIKYVNTVLLFNLLHESVNDAIEALQNKDSLIKEIFPFFMQSVIINIFFNTDQIFNEEQKEYNFIIKSFIDKNSRIMTQLGIHAPYAFLGDLAREFIDGKLKEAIPINSKGIMEDFIAQINSCFPDQSQQSGGNINKKKYIRNKTKKQKKATRRNKKTSKSQLNHK